MTITDDMIKNASSSSGYLKSLTVSESNWNNPWGQDLTRFTEDFISCVEKNLFPELGVTIDCLLDKRIINAKNVKLFDDDIFASKAIESNKIETGIQAGYSKDNLKKTYGKAILISSDKNEGFYPSMNKTAVVSDRKGLHYLVHEMMHVLANPAYVETLRTKEDPIGDEGINEFFARFASIYYINKNPNATGVKSAEGVGLYQNKYPLNCKSNISVDKTKELAKSYFLKE